MYVRRRHDDTNKVAGHDCNPKTALHVPRKAANLDFPNIKHNSTSHPTRPIGACRTNPL